ncbi:cuticle protein 16.5-like, partial [Lucilia cuprina]
PAHSFSSAEGYRYRTSKRRVIRRRRRDVSHLSSEYLPPHQGAASAPSAEYLPPVAASAPVAQFESAPAVSYSAPAASYSAPAASYSAPAVSYESAATEPAHSFSSAEGYRYKTAKRRVIRRRRY